MLGAARVCAGEEACDFLNYISGPLRMNIVTRAFDYLQAGVGNPRS